MGCGDMLGELSNGVGAVKQRYLESLSGGTAPSSIGCLVMEACDSVLAEADLSRVPATVSRLFTARELVPYSSIPYQKILRQTAAGVRLAESLSSQLPAFFASQRWPCPTEGCAAWPQACADRSSTHATCHPRSEATGCPPSAPHGTARWAPYPTSPPFRPSTKQLQQPFDAVSPEKRVEESDGDRRPFGLRGGETQRIQPMGMVVSAIRTTPRA